MPTREDMDEIDLFGTKVPNKNATCSTNPFLCIQRFISNFRRWFRTSFIFLFWAPLLEELWSSWVIKWYYFYNFTFLRDSSFYFRCSWFSLTFLWWLIGNCIRNIGNEKPFRKRHQGTFDIFHVLWWICYFAQSQLKGFHLCVSGPYHQLYNETEPVIAITCKKD